MNSFFGNLVLAAQAINTATDIKGNACIQYDGRLCICTFNRVGADFCFCIIAHLIIFSTCFHCLYSLLKVSRYVKNNNLLFLGAVKLVRLQ